MRLPKIFCAARPASTPMACPGDRCVFHPNAKSIHACTRHQAVAAAKFADCVWRSGRVDYRKFRSGLPLNVALETNTEETNTEEKLRMKKVRGVE